MSATPFAIVACILATMMSSGQAGAPPAAARTLVAHVVVVLCDNANQGIVPVPRALGNGQNPNTNLYWGARYGVRTYFRQAPGWKPVAMPGERPSGMLERVAFRATFAPGAAFVVADAWDGARMREALAAFVDMASGRRPEPLVLDDVATRAGGAADVIVFVGHNGLMDAAAPVFDEGAAAPGRAAIVLACASKPYFEPLLRRAGARPLLLTTGLMAPEAYSLEAALRAMFTGAPDADVRRAAAQAYSTYQKTSVAAARRLFDATSVRAR